jgi:signal transduction histidine kinase/FixJ family two-component response regulator
MSILIADDDFISRNLLKVMLEKIGYNPIVTEDGADAWDRYNEKMPQIVISDWMMPKMDGLELCRKIRSISTESYTYIIIVTTKAETHDLIEAFNSGADDYILKPFDPEELKVRIKNSERILELENRHKNFQKILERSRNKLQIVLDGLYEEIAAIDRSNLFVSLNKAARSAVGIDYNDLIGKNCFKVNQKLTEPIWGNTIEKLSKKVFESGLPEFTLDKYRDQKGNLKFKQQSILPIKVEDGHIEQVILVSRDVTQEYIKTDEIKKLNEKLKKTTVEVNAKNVKLKTALKQLEETQAQILQSEKMASIGQLAAGVAHEINNPVGFVNSNLRTLGDYRKDFSQLIDKYRHFIKEVNNNSETIKLPPQLATQLKEIETIEKDVDVEYIQEDFGELINDCLDGTERIRKIVLSLKDFAHPGEDKLKDTDINNGLESTLNVVNNELKYKAKIIKKLNILPIIQCYPQQINQVFMNILVNAAQAIEKSGEITIETEVKEDAVEVRISDTGCGIPKENLTRIFDPFFTTKDVGKGTGLGMNIVYNIIKKHNGSITVDSEVGKGTTFTIRLPLTPGSSDE